MNAGLRRLSAAALLVLIRVPGRVMTAEIAAGVHERLAGYRDRFNSLFADYFDTVARQQFPRSAFVPETLELVRDMSLRGGNASVSLCCTRRRGW